MKNAGPIVLLLAVFCLLSPLAVLIFLWLARVAQLVVDLFPTP